MAYELYVGKVTDEPDTWVLGTIKRVNTKYAVIQQRCEYPFAKCCGVGDFEVYTDSLIKVPIDEGEEENTKLKDENVILKQEIAQLEEQCEKLIEKRDALTIHKDKEIAIRDRALELCCASICDNMEAATPLVEMWMRLAKVEVENDERRIRKAIR